MKNLLIILFLFLTLSGYCQSKFSIGLLGSLDAAVIRQSNSSSNLYYTYSNSQLFSYQFSVRGRYDFTKKISLQSGISLVSYQTSGMFDITISYNGSSFGIDHSEFVTSDKILQIPLLFSFYFGNKFKFGLTTGVAYNIPFYSSVTLTRHYDDGRIEEYSNDNSRVFTPQNQFVSGIVGVGAEYRIKSYSIRVEPTGTYQLFNISDLSLWTMGINLSAYYHF